MQFYEVVTIVGVMRECPEFGPTHLVELNGIFGHEEKYGIAEPGGYAAISDETAKEIIEAMENEHT